MDMIETLERKITDGEEFNEMDVAFIKENIDMILSRDNYLEYLFPINDLDFLKSLVLEKRVANQDFIASLCYELQDDSFFAPSPSLISHETKSDVMAGTML